VAWNWGPHEDRARNEIKLKLENAVKIGSPQPFGEIAMMTDASDIGGGACLFKWQKLDPQVLQNFLTKVVNPDGS